MSVGSSCSGSHAENFVPPPATPPELLASSCVQQQQLSQQPEAEAPAPGSVPSGSSGGSGGWAPAGHALVEFASGGDFACGFGSSPLKSVQVCKTEAKHSQKQKQKQFSSSARGLRERFESQMERSGAQLYGAAEGCGGGAAAPSGGVSVCGAGCGVGCCVAGVAAGCPSLPLPRLSLLSPLLALPLLPLAVWTPPPRFRDDAERRFARWGGCCFCFCSCCCSCWCFCTCCPPLPCCCCRVRFGPRLPRFRDDAERRFARWG